MNTSFKSILWLPLVALLGACNGCSQDHVSDILFTLDFESLPSDLQMKKIESNEYVADYIPILLETSSECIFKDIAQLEEIDSYFFIRSSDGVIYRFDKKGRFNRKIGVKGHGPGEYVSAKKIAIDESSQIVYVMDYFGRKMLIYSFDGDFLDSFRLPEDYNIINVYNFNTNLYYCSMNNSIKPDLFRLSRNHIQIDTLSYHDREMLEGEAIVGDTYLFRGGEEIRLFHYFNDTIYTLKDEHLQPAYLIKTGEFTYRFRELLIDFESGRGLQTTGYRLKIDNVIELPSLILIEYSVFISDKEKQQRRLAMYDRRKEVFFPCVTLHNSENPHLSLNGEQRLFYSKKKNCIFAAFESFNLMEADFVSGLKEDDNPVLVQIRMN